MANLAPSAHVDTFCRDNLPPVEQWPQFVFELPELAYPQRLNCATALLDDIVDRYGPDRPCLISATQRWSYGDLLHRVNRIAQVLVEDLGLVPGNRVLLRGPNTPALVACWFGVIKAGGVVVTTMSMLRTPELQELAHRTQPVIAFCDSRSLAELAVVDYPMRIVTFDGAGNGQPAATDPAEISGSDTELDRRCAAKSGQFNAVDTAADDVVLLAPTSGSTGEPKITMHFHRDVLANADTFSAHVLKPRSDDVFIGTPPLAFTFGLGGLLVFPLYAGASTVLVERATPIELAQLVHQHQATVVFTAPTAYRTMAREGAAGLLGSMRRCVSAGESLPSATSDEFFDATGVRIIDGIGSTEMLHVFISAADDDIRPGATGKPVPGYIANIVDMANQPVADGVPGQLAVKGPTGCRYLADKRQLEYVRDGWNITGDIYVRDADGYFWHQSRSDDMIVSAGYNIAAPEVEFALYGHPDVIECAVVGIPDEQRGQLVHAAVVLADGAARDAGEVRVLQDFVKSVIAPYKYPRSIEFVDQLPRNESGKLQRFKVKEADHPVAN
jgi:2-aminobenzoate-CoA ligase